MKSIAILIIFICFQLSGVSQTINKKYVDDMEEINEYLLGGEYADALPILQKLEKEGYMNANISYKLGLCYLNSVFEKARSVSYLEKACKSAVATYNTENIYEKNSPLKAFLYLGDAYRANNRLLEAEKTYKNYQALVKGDTKEQEVSEKRVFESQMAQLFMKRPAKIQIEKLGGTINNGFGNFNACISGDGNSMVYTQKMKFYDALFFCTRVDGQWQEPREITVNVGSDGEFHPTGLSPDGKRMLLTSYNHFTGSDIYESIFKDGKWHKVKLLGKSINSAFQDIDAVYGPTGKEIYFSSNRTSGFGGFDLYKASIDEADNIGEAENLGKSINTEWDEKSPSFADNGKVLFFSSQRNPSMGGLDFFYSRKNADGIWSQAFNAGYPLSTVGDDIGFSTKIAGNEGLLARYSDVESAEGDIFNVKYNTLSQFRLIPLKGDVKVKDTTGNFAGLNLFFIDETIKDTVGVVKSPDGGQYRIDLYPGDFRLVMAKDNSGSVSKSFTIPADLANPDYELSSEYAPDIKKTSVISATAANDTIFVADILFDFDKATITPEAKVLIDKLIIQLKNHTVTKIELVGFTDCLGNKMYNKNLSLKRASTVKAYLVETGISKEIVSCKGMGDAVLVAKNKNADGSDNPEGRGFNRRVEITIECADKHLIFIKKALVPAQLKP